MVEVVFTFSVDNGLVLLLVLIFGPFSFIFLTFFSLYILFLGVRSLRNLLEIMRIYFSSNVESYSFLQLFVDSIFLANLRNFIVDVCICKDIKVDLLVVN